MVELGFLTRLRQSPLGSFVLHADGGRVALFRLVFQSVRFKFRILPMFLRSPKLVCAAFLVG